MQTLSLCMIVKNEEKNIEKCLNSVASIVDEIIIVDTGSKDKTIEIANRFHAKVFNYCWDENFSNARNQSLQNATGDWILVLDADEVIDGEDLQTLTEKIQTTTANGLVLMFHNFTQENSEENFITHTGLRLFRNHMFYYEGAIHEQLIQMDKSLPYHFEEVSVRVLHYGYLKSNVVEKNKHKRNVPLIQKLLDENPEDAFQLFNMGNEYMSQNNYEKALLYYEKANKYKDITQAYCPHLLYRRAACLHYLRKNQESLYIIEEGLSYYPTCTDLEFLRGAIYKAQKRYTLAIDSFTHCISMGIAPKNLVFINDTATFRPLMELAQIYFLQDDWNRSLDYYVKALQINGKRYDIIYKIGRILNKMFSNKADVCENLEKLFADRFYITNVLVMVDILIDEGLYSEAEIYLKRIESVEEYEMDKKYLNSRISFFKKEYQIAHRKFLSIIAENLEKSILYNVMGKSLEYLIVCSLICNDHATAYNLLMQKSTSEEEQRILAWFLEEKEDSFEKTARSKIFSILSLLLKVFEVDLFEQKLSILNLIESNEILLDLANLYYENGYKDLAVKNILRSVKELDVINGDAVYLLNKEI